MKKTLKVIKIGGNVINSPDALELFLQAFSKLDGNKILVHGGGAVAGKIMEEMGIQPRMIDGRRITDEATLQVVTMVYAGLINKRVVAVLQRFGDNALGLSGADGNVIRAVKRPAGEIDYGFAGDVEAVNTTVIDGLLNMGLVPVFNSIVHNRQGQLLNTNADTIASEVAAAMSGLYETELIYVFEKPGVMSDPENGTVIPLITEKDFERLKAEGVISSGMIPKMTNCFNALRRGVERVFITGKDNFTGDEKGTKVKLH